MPKCLKGAKLLSPSLPFRGPRGTLIAPPGSSRLLNSSRLSRLRIQPRCSAAPASPPSDARNTVRRRVPPSIQRRPLALAWEFPRWSGLRSDAEPPGSRVILQSNTVLIEPNGPNEPWARLPGPPAASCPAILPGIVAWRIINKPNSNVCSVSFGLPTNSSAAPWLSAILAALQSQTFAHQKTAE
ncbi:hypothetical protein CC85DRAFT_167337 [Cutaneotrichosporon oleaginosum]|uniref:Uncharacterized protein n=1 Tax=Cutaneotrichosporon oleaginosum TaxID=879819 RepID=A0A0J0XFS3_9TREE|nr:uncharacterized protein CC85DRAFT_167337 [Cutaneotrichosporon oleaginosum]KLT39917.1 hypothetical protein CC85DRAFT_167337 [Cutaneotrichosporon oleaginosum]TXT08331.1 hypothetical protein COLE_05255 [Cutaneotrichosporon oleaginosum]